MRLVAGLGSIAFAGIALGPLALAPRPPYADGPPPGYTGGFGEPTCHQCHFDGPIDDPNGQLTAAGLPDRYEPGTRYPLTIRLARPGLRRAGFQLAFRFIDGPRKGAQAGDLTATSDRVQIVTPDEGGTRYAEQTGAGSEPDEPGRTRWRLEWTAPDSGRVVVHAAANAANGDASEFGDFIYVWTDSIGPVDP